MKKLLYLPLLLISACSPLKVLDTVVTDKGYHLTRNVAYGVDAVQRLDIYKPTMSMDKTKPTPIVVFFYGGRWQSQYGNKADYRFVGQAFAARGFVTIIADTRLYPQVKYPVFLNDGADVIAWAHKNGAEYGGDTSKIVTVGHSSGAYSSVMLAVNPAYKVSVCAAIGMAGPYDFLPLTDPDIIRTFNGETHSKMTQPIYYATGRKPPLLLMTGARDKIVLPENAYNLARELKKYQSPVETITYPNLGHIGIVLSLAHGFQSIAPALDDAVRFINDTCK